MDKIRVKTRLACKRTKTKLTPFGLENNNKTRIKSNVYTNYGQYSNCNEPLRPVFVFDIEKKRDQNNNQTKDYNCCNTYSTYLLLFALLWFDPRHQLNTMK